MIQEHQYTAENCMDMLTARRVIRDRLWKPKKTVRRNAIESGPKKKVQFRWMNAKHDAHVVAFTAHVMEERRRSDETIAKYRELHTPQTKLFSVLAIKRAVLSGTRYTVKDIESDCRKREITYYRQVAMYRLWLEGRSLPFIGRQFGGRDHTTALNAVRKMKHLEAIGILQGGWDSYERYIMERQKKHTRNALLAKARKQSKAA